MYIEPLALFIIAEVVLVIVIIGVFLFHRSRLLRVLLALLTEMRMNRARREVKKKQELAELRQQNNRLHKENDQFREEGQQTYSEQLQNRLSQLEETPGAESDADADDPEADGHRTRAILRAFYQFETARSAPEQYDLKAAEDRLLEDLKIQLGREPDEEESEAVKTQTAQLLERVAELEPLLPKLKSAESENAALRAQVSHAQEQIEELEKINSTAERPPESEQIKSNAETDEIYRLKCERFDMAESINALKLKLQKMVGDGDVNDLLEIQEEQIRQQDRYIRDAEASIALLEKQLEHQKAQEDTTHAAPIDTDALTRAHEQRDKLTAYAEEQKSSMQGIRDNLVAMRKAEKAEELEALMADQEVKLSAMERAVQESDTCVAMMENELQNANQTIVTLQSQIDEQPAPAEELLHTAEKYRHQADEMESILRKLMQDSEDMVSCIRELEAENQSLKSEKTTS